MLTFKWLVFLLMLVTLPYQYQCFFPPLLLCVSAFHRKCFNSHGAGNFCLNIHYVVCFCCTFFLLLMILCIFCIMKQRIHIDPEQNSNKIKVPQRVSWKDLCQDYHRTPLQMYLYQKTCLLASLIQRLLLMERVATLIHIELSIHMALVSYFTIHI